MATTSISKSSLIENVWRNFYDRVKDQVTTTTLVDSSVVTVQNYLSAYSDEIFDVRGNYPIIIIESPTFSTDFFTLGRDQMTGSITIEIYTTNSQAADNFTSDIFNAVETYKGDFADVGLHMIKVDSTDTDMVEREQLKIHVRRLTFSFVYRYTKSNTF